MTAGDTRARILDATESLFIEAGYEATSLRQVTSRASVNLAADGTVLSMAKAKAKPLAFFPELRTSSEVKKKASETTAGP